MGKQNSGTLPNPPLPWWESTIYVVTWIIFNLLMVKSVLEASRDNADIQELAFGLDNGWTFLGRKRDISDSEWEVWHESMSGAFGKWIFGHVIMSQLLRTPSLFPKRRYAFLLYSLLFYFIVLGAGQLLLIILEILVVFSIVWFTASSFLVWTFSLTFLLFLILDSLRMPLVKVGLLSEGHFYENLIQEFTLSMTVQRLISFGLFNCEHRKKMAKPKTHSSSVKAKSPITNLKMLPEKAHLDADDRCKVKDDFCAEVTDGSGDAGGDSCNAFNWEVKAFSGNAVEQLSNLFLYIFYLPLLVSGPMMNYDVFYKQYHSGLQSWSTARLKPMLFRFLRYGFWAFVHEFSLHYLYCGAIMVRPRVLSALPLWAVAGVGYLRGMFFVLKYAAIWGISASIARLDQLQPPDIPRCGSCIYLCSQMWKTFDQGLHAFMKQHVFITLGGSRCGPLRRVFALMACFGFVAVWHGLTDNTCFWCLINFLCLLLEVAAGYFVALSPVREFEVKYLSPAMTHRLHSLATAPVLGTSLFSLMTFFGGLKSGGVIFSRLVYEGFPVSTLAVFMGFYCLVQTGKEVENYKSKCQHSKTG